MLTLPCGGPLRKHNVLWLPAANPSASPLQRPLQRCCESARLASLFSDCAEKARVAEPGLSTRGGCMRRCTVACAGCALSQGCCCASPEPCGLSRAPLGCRAHAGSPGRLHSRVCHWLAPYDAALHDAPYRQQPAMHPGCCLTSLHGVGVRWHPHTTIACCHATCI